MRDSGNLSTKSLTPIVDPSLLVQDSEYLETHLVVVPTNARKDFIRSYETIAPMVVPRSSIQVAQDDEFTLFAVTTFKKTSAEFLQKCREQKWTPRQYKYVEGGREEEKRELDRVAKEEKKVWGEALRLGRTGWSETVMIWAHVMTLRVFVETVLRYGLPLEFVSALVKVRAESRFCPPPSPPPPDSLVDVGRRRPPSRQRRSRRRWTRHTHTSEEMLLGGINEAGLLRTTRR
jgi:V-type H+-transporting ATPase subunit C